MTKEELIFKGKHKVRNTPDLMRIYKELFIQEFGRAPAMCCSGFAPDWNAFERGIVKFNQQNQITMAGKTFVYTGKRNEILVFRKNGVPHKKYAYKADDNFMIDFLTYGTAQEIEERKKLFKVLPQGMAEKKEAVNDAPKPVTAKEVVAAADKPKRKRQPKKK